MAGAQPRSGIERAVGWRQVRERRPMLRTAAPLDARASAQTPAPSNARRTEMVVGI
jgi:hypothetical protein